MPLRESSQEQVENRTDHSFDKGTVLVGVPLNSREVDLLAYDTGNFAIPKIPDSNVMQQVQGVGEIGVLCKRLSIGIVVPTKVDLDSGELDFRVDETGMAINGDDRVNGT